MAVATPVFLIFAPDRLRVLTRLLALAGAVAIATGPIFDVYDTGDYIRDYDEFLEFVEARRASPLP